MPSQPLQRSVRSRVYLGPRKAGRSCSASCRVLGLVVYVHTRR